MVTKENLKVPFDRSYWVVPGKFLAGCYPGAKRFDEARKKLDALLGSGIRLFINFMEEAETDWQGDSFEAYEENIRVLARERGFEIECLRIPIQDGSIPTFETMKGILDVIDLAIGQDKRVYVHCWGGKGRTGTVVGCWLIRHGRTTPEGILSVIEDPRKNDPTRFEPSPEEREAAMDGEIMEGRRVRLIHA